MNIAAASNGLSGSLGVFHFVAKLLWAVAHVVAGVGAGAVFGPSMAEVVAMSVTVQHACWRGIRRGGAISRVAIAIVARFRLGEMGQRRQQLVSGEAKRGIDGGGLLGVRKNAVEVRLVKRCTTERAGPRLGFDRGQVNSEGGHQIRNIARIGHRGSRHVIVDVDNEGRKWRKRREIGAVRGIQSGWNASDGKLSQSYAISKR